VLKFLVARQEVLRPSIDRGEQDRNILRGKPNSRRQTPRAGSSTISNGWTSRYRRVRCSALTTFLSASTMAYADVTSCVAGKLQSTRNRLSARQAAETRILASRNTRARSHVRRSVVRDRIGIEPELFYLPAGGRVICGVDRILEQELGESSRRVPFANLRRRP
jgi:hypothetical protein